MNDYRERTGKSFNSSADQYDRVRPSYPKALIDDTIKLSGLPKNGRILEIGCGTGQATEPFAARGYSLDCLDVGEDLAAIAAEKFKDFDKVQVSVTSFEDWDPCGVSYDLVLAASSFHWINPQIRFTKSAAILRETGALVLFAIKHVRKDEGFFAKVQEIYRMHAPSMDRMANERKKLWVEPVMGEDLFNESIIRIYPWAVDYSTEEYIALLGTYSDHLSLPEDERLALFAHIAELIREEYAGVVRKNYEAVLTLRTVKPNKEMQRTRLRSQKGGNT